MKLPGTWKTVNNVRTYSRKPEPFAPTDWARIDGHARRPPKRLIMASSHGRMNPVAGTPEVTACPWCRKPGHVTPCSKECTDARRQFVSHCSSYGLDGIRLLREHGRLLDRQAAADYDRPVPTPYALALLADRPESGSDEVRMAASFHADRLCEMISENLVDLGRVPGFDCEA